MSIMSKLKGEKKVAEKKDGGKGKQPAQEQKNEERPSVSRTWTADNMRQINRSVQPPMSRTSSDYSTRSARMKLPRSTSGLSQEWTPGSNSNMRPSASSHKSMSRSVSYQGLPKVLEDGDVGHLGFDIPPMPIMPSRYSAASSSSSSRPRSARSPLSSGNSIAASSFGKSTMSSTEVSPVDSEESSNTSSNSNDILEMRSHPFSHPEQYVFQRDQSGEPVRHDSKGKGKGKAPMFPVELDLDRNDYETSRKVEKPAERIYFTRDTPLGAKASELDSRPTTPATNSPPKSPVDAPKLAKKRSRFSLFGKKGDDSVAV